ncbi:MAG TPA: hypothetical protein VHJ20_21825 [Polyangia bacterium]|nr:hypothetical protein [Polyangia bacterium]
MKTNIGKKVAGAIALALALAGGVGAARAATNILSGNECQAFYPPDVVPDGQGVYHTTSGTENISSNKGVRLVMCPVLRDNTGTTGGLQKLVVRTTVASGFSGATQCFGMTHTMYGSIKVGTWQTAASTGSSAMTWTNLTQSDNGSGAYDIQCNVVYAGTINSIEYQEP